MAIGKTRIDGTAYEITGGKTRIDGTAYKLTGGKTRIDGTVYGISFGKPLTVSGTYISGDNYYAFASFADEILNDGSYTYDESKSYILIDVYGLQTNYNQYNRVYLNGSLVKSGSGTYKLTNINNYNSIKIVFESQNYNTYFYCYITTT